MSLFLVWHIDIGAGFAHFVHYEVKKLGFQLFIDNSIKEIKYIYKLCSDDAIYRSRPMKLNKAVQPGRLDIPLVVLSAVDDMK